VADIALIVIATGAAYHPYIRPLVASAQEFFPPHEVLLFTDSREVFAVSRQVWIKDLGYPRATLMRYHAITSEAEWLSKFEHCFYTDVDMRFVSPISRDELASEGITATEHLGYANRMPSRFWNFVSPVSETRETSTACLKTVDKYFCGGFVGGRTPEFLKMSSVIQKNVDTDTENGVLAVWHDESHLNRYLADTPPARILPPSFCYPETNREYYLAAWRRDYVPKLLALTK
jgi:histo-blood group ABO system transferase